MSTESNIESGINVIVENSVDVVCTTPSSEVSTQDVNTIIIENNDLDVSVSKREFIVSSDDIYIPSFYNDAPEWMKNQISDGLELVKTAAEFNINQNLTSMLSNFASSYVPNNQYTMSVISEKIGLDGRLNAVIETLNSNVEESNAQIINLGETIANIGYSAASQISALSSTVGATSSDLIEFKGLQTTKNNTTSFILDSLSSRIDDANSGIAGNSNATSILKTYVGVDANGGLTGTGLLSDVKILQKQNDGVIETNTGTWDVMIGIENPNNNRDNDQLDVAKEPYATWKAIDALNKNSHERYSHLGDVYIKYTNTTEGYKTYDRAYKFIKVTPDATSPYSTDTEGFTWALITDTDAQNAYVAALNALDLADSKRRVFVDTPTVPYNIGDLWIKSVSGGNQLYKSGANRTDLYNIADWKVADDAQINNFVSNVYEPDMLDLQSQVDSQINYYFYKSSLSQTPVSISGSAVWNAESKKEHHGDIAYDKTTNTGYYYDRTTSTWIAITGSENAGVIESLKAASIAQATADNKISHMYGVYQNSTPTTDGTYKYWLTASKILKVLSGTSWVDVSISKIYVGDIITVWDSVLKDEFKYYWNGGTWYSKAQNGLVAGSKSAIDLTTNLSALGVTVAGHTSQVNTIDSRIANGVSTVESKWAYNSSLTINGVTYPSGFGLSNSAGTGIGSEFWINADKFKFTNNSKTGSKAPFTIATDGLTPEITFNGKVSFSNVSDTSALISSISTAQYTANTANSNALARTLPSEVANAINTNTTTINGAKITTGSIDALRLSVSKLSSITANLGTITTGKIQNTSGTNFIDLNATGSSSFIKVGNNVDIKADGSGYFSRTLISEPNVIAQGTHTIPANEVVVNNFTVYIPTGYKAFDTWNVANEKQYLATATISSGISDGGGANGYGKTEIYIGDGLTTGTFNNTNPSVKDGYVYIKYTWEHKSGSGYIIAKQIDWKLVRI